MITQRPSYITRIFAELVRTSRRTSTQEGTAMNVDTGDMGDMLEVLKRAKPGEKVIPAIIIPDPRPTPALYGPRKPLREVRKEIAAAQPAHKKG